MSVIPVDQEDVVIGSGLPDSFLCLLLYSFSFSCTNVVRKLRRSQGVFLWSFLRPGIISRCLISSKCDDPRTQHHRPSHSRPIYFNGSFAQPCSVLPFTRRFCAVR
jgi:hypothetical protein